MNEYKKQEYRKKQVVNDGNVKSTGTSTVKNNIWNVKEKEVQELRRIANKYSVLDSLPEESILDQNGLNTNGNGHRQEVVNKGDGEPGFEDVLSCKNGTAKVMSENVVNDIEGNVLHNDC